MASTYFENDGDKSMQELVDAARRDNPMLGSPLVLTHTMGNRKDKALMFFRVGTVGELRPEDVAALNPDEEVYDDTAKQVVRLGDLAVYKMAIASRD